MDKFSDVLVVQSLALGIDKMKMTIIRLLEEVLAADGVKIRGGILHCLLQSKWGPESSLAREQWIFR